MQGQLRQLRDEIDLQQEQRTNQNLYLLSVITALLLPPTLVTGFLGMNTGGLRAAPTPPGVPVMITSPGSTVGARATFNFRLQNG